MKKLPSKKKRKNGELIFIEISYLKKNVNSAVNFFKIENHFDG